MGIDIEGGMIVGAPVDDIALPMFEDEDGDEFYTDKNGEHTDNLNDWFYSYNMTTYSMWYDAGSRGQVAGFPVPDVDPLDEDEFGSWIDLVRSLAEQFEDITGTKAKLIGMQDVW